MAKDSDDSGEKPSISVVTINNTDILGVRPALGKFLDLVQKSFGPLLKKRMADASAYQIRKTAEAVRDARQILGHADYRKDGLTLNTPLPGHGLESNTLINRAQERVMLRDIKQQINIESVMVKTVEHLKDAKEVPTESVDEDWASKFFDIAGSVSNEEMQTLWAKILASEIKQPGSYSRRTLGCVGLMEKNDALAFEQLCRFSCLFKGLQPFILDYKDDFYTSRGINFDILLHLANVGLITLGRLQRFIKIVPKHATVAYRAQKLHLTFKKTKANEFDTGQVMFAQMGTELSQICSSEPIDGFIPYLLAKWKKQGIRIRMEKGKI